MRWVRSPVRASVVYHAADQENLTMAKRTGLASLSVTELQKELRRRSRRLPALQRRRDRVAARVAALDEQIAALGGTSRNGYGGGRKRPRNEMKLVDALAQTLKGKTMRVMDAAEAVQKAGYRTSATPLGFRIMVNQILLKGGPFKRVARGLYTAK
jgi:hypothetical protein